MPKQLYEFDKKTFRNQLFEEYIVPASIWLLGELTNPYLLPQISGSNWECALSLESLLKLLDIDFENDNLTKDNIKNKSLQTVRWLISRVNKNDDDTLINWDGGFWDTAICIRAIMIAEKKIESSWSIDDQKNIENLKIGTARWLINSCINWDQDVRYPVGPSDLGQVLNTLSIINKNDPGIIKQIESELNLQNKSIEKIARKLIAMRDIKKEIIDEHEIELNYWMDCFNTSEVLEGLVSYLKNCFNVLYYNTKNDEIKEVISVIHKSIIYLESSQNNGCWDGVADTCGTLYGYLKTVNSLQDIEPKDYIVFKALRWICDEKQVLHDGSFLHTSYITVFYLMSIIEVYNHWELGNCNGPEVYDIALWSSPGEISMERSLRFDIQLELKDCIKKCEMLEYVNQRQRKLNIGIIIISLQLFFLFAILLIFNVLGITIKLINSNALFQIITIAIPIILVSVSAIASGIFKHSRLYINKKNHQNNEV